MLEGIYNVLKIFVRITKSLNDIKKKVMRILALTRYSVLGASSRLRIYQYQNVLKKYGIEVKLQALLDDFYIKRLYSGRRKDPLRIFSAYFRRLIELLKINRFELIWIEKELFPFFPAWGEQFINALGIPYVVDYDDAVFYRYESHPNRLVRLLFKRKIEQVMRGAEVVIVGNNYLRDKALSVGAKRVELIPTVVDLNRYKANRKIPRGHFKVGWIGSPSTSSYLKIIENALAKFYVENPIMELLLVGSGPIELVGIPVNIVPWSEKTEVEIIQSFDVGIMPLPDTTWTWGKCGYKLIQYMACSLPVIASPIGANLEIVEPGLNGFLAKGEQEWMTALNELYRDRELRELLGRNGRRKVEEHYCVQVTAPKLSEILYQAASKRFCHS
jgi:glycosyltransferase involved in cell wall biosynthesis